MVMELECDVYPPSLVLFLEEEIVSNGLLPWVDIGLLIEYTILHLAGQERFEPAALVGPYVPFAMGTEWSIYFHAKPGVRDVMIAVLLDGYDVATPQAGGPPSVGDRAGQLHLECTLEVGSDSQVLEQEVQVADIINASSQAQWRYFEFRNVGDDPGHMDNQDDQARVIIKEFDDLSDLIFTIWTVQVIQHHTVTVEQDDT